jgi:hypothetical protein
MKNFLKVSLAILLAISIGAFSKKKSYTTFVYVGPGYDGYNVRNIFNWEVGVPDCNSGLDMACSFTVPDQYSDGFNPIFLEIITAQSPNYNNYVVQVQDMQTHASIAQSIANKNGN